MKLMKKEDLFSIPDSVSLKEAREDEEFNFLFSKVKSKKPKFDLNKYIYFHKELRFGVYKHENKFYLAKIKKHIQLGKYVKPHIQVVGEISMNNWEILKSSISGATFLNKGSESEQLFLQFIVGKERTLYEERILEEKKAEEKTKKRGEEKQRQDKENLMNKLQRRRKQRQDKENLMNKLQRRRKQRQDKENLMNKFLRRRRQRSYFLS